MFSSTPEEFSAATKAAFESQIAVMSSLAQKAFDGVEKLIELNMTVTKSALEESSAAVKQMIEAKDAKEVLSLSTASAKPNTEKAMSYARHVAGIASEVQAEFSRAAEAQMAETNRKIVAMVDEAAKNAPAGSESAIAMFKSALGTANANYEQFTRSTKQAVESMESNVTAAVSQLTQVAPKAPARATKK